MAAVQGMVAVQGIPELFRITSELDIDPAIRIISLSDIHGDIDALIIALRDCATVIQSKSNIPNNLNNTRDPELDRLLNLDLNILANMQDFDLHDDLNFNWIGNNTHVVIVGDILDPVRRTQPGIPSPGDTPPMPGRRNVNDLYPQAEIKILKFLNRLDILANNFQGRVIKLIGNHELANFIPAHIYSSLYTHDGAEQMPYINGQIIETMPRQSFFNAGNPGFTLFMARCSGVFLRINNTLFMHGQVYNHTNPAFTFEHCNNFNTTINSGNYSNLINFTQAPQLWDREYGEDRNIDRRLRSPIDAFCRNVPQDITNFLSDHPNQRALPPVHTFRLVIGHCPQFNSTVFNEMNRSFTTHNQTDNIVTLTRPAATFTASTPFDNVFGISMECPEILEPHHKIYKVDVGVSRAFDQSLMYDMIQNHNTMKKFFMSRVPQVLLFVGDDVQIIRSTVKNARIHQYRENLERIITDRVTSGQLPHDFNTAMTYGGYKQKYLKYKSKYLELKKKFNI